MDPIRHKLSLLLTETARNRIRTLEPDSPCAEELSKIGEVDDIIVQEVEKLCSTATLAQIARILYLAALIKTTSGRRREAIKNDIKLIAEKLVARTESETGPLRLPETCRHLLLSL
ncbi:MAG TPA: hypothetical protein HPP87_04475 [Planctomycetes bacterium]|nr:hypothetical protein [Planctomycetota bacterium]